jgi:hypothetical protein
MTFAIAVAALAAEHLRIRTVRLVVADFATVEAPSARLPFLGALGGAMARLATASGVSGVDDVWTTYL